MRQRQKLKTVEYDRESHTCYRSNATWDADGCCTVIRSMQQHVSIVHVPGGTPIKSGVDADILHETLDFCGFSILAHTPAE